MSFMPGTQVGPYFTAWEDFRLRSASTMGTRMPSAAMRQGDYSGLLDNIGR
jgi:hypothetical protein